MSYNKKFIFQGLFVMGLFASFCSFVVAEERTKRSENPNEMFEATEKKLGPKVREMTEEEKASLVNVEMEKKKEEEKFEKMAPSGVIASFGGGVGSQNVGTLGESATTKGDQPPLTASVKKEGEGWSVKISNSSKKHISATIRVDQFRKGGKSPSKTDNMSVSLAGGAEMSQRVSPGPETQSVQVGVASWTAH